MDSKEALLSSWQDGKARPSLEDGYANQQRKTRAKARNPFNLVGYVILVLIAFGIVRMVQIKIGYILSNREIKINTYTDDASVRYIKDIKDVRMISYLFFIFAGTILVISPH